MVSNNNVPSFTPNTRQLLCARRRGMWLTGCVRLTLLKKSVLRPAMRPEAGARYARF